jgi:NitT/TauT family transport system substrate-binding protein
MRRRDFLGTALAAAVGCSHDTAQKLRVAVSTSHSVAPIFLAQELGFFTEEGLDVEMVQLVGPAAHLAALAGGQVAVSMAAFNSAMVNAVAAGAKVRVVAARDFTSPCAGATTVYARRDDYPGGIRDLHQLRGKIIAFRGAGNNTEYRIETMLQAAGLSRNDVQWLPLAREEAIAAVLQGRADAVIDEDFDKRLDEATDKLVGGIQFSDTFPRFQRTHIMYGPTLLEGDAGRGIAMLCGYLRGVWSWLDGKTPKFLYDYAASNRMDVERLDENCRDNAEVNGDIHRQDIQSFVDWAVRRGYCARAVPIDQIIDTRFLEGAWKRIGRRAES